jgi:hypothetical protein
MVSDGAKREDYDAIYVVYNNTLSQTDRGVVDNRASISIMPFGMSLITPNQGTSSLADSRCPGAIPSTQRAASLSRQRDTGRLESEAHGRN